MCPLYHLAQIGIFIAPLCGFYSILIVHALTFFFVDPPHLTTHPQNGPQIGLVMPKAAGSPNPRTNNLILDDHFNHTRSVVSSRLRSNIFYSRLFADH